MGQICAVGAHISVRNLVVVSGYLLNFRLPSLPQVLIVMATTVAGGIKFLGCPVCPSHYCFNKVTRSFDHSITVNSFAYHSSAVVHSNIVIEQLTVAAHAVALLHLRPV